MRSDVKLGIICLFVLLMGAVGYVAWSGGGNRARTAPGTPGAGPAGHGAGPETPVGETGTRVPPPSSPSPFGARPAYGDPIPAGSGATTGPAPVVGGPGLLTQPPSDPMLRGDIDPRTPTTGPRPGGVEIGRPEMPPVDNTGRLGGTRDLSTRDLGTRDLDIGSPVGGGRGLATRPAPGPGMKAGGLAGAPVLPIGETTDYEVKQGDTIWTVAKHFHVTRAALAAANNIPVDSQLKLKQKLKIPAATPGAAPAGGVTPPAGGPTTRAATKPAAGMPAAKFPTYTVKKGDDLSKVSEAAYGDRKYWKKIYTANKAAIGENPNVLKEGLVLKMP